MTPPREIAVREARGPQTVEQLRARVAELEQQLRTRPPATAQASPSAHPPQWQPVAITFLAGSVLVTTPLALLTVKRWWDWWTE